MKLRSVNSERREEAYQNEIGLEMEPLVEEVYQPLKHDDERQTEINLKREKQNLKCVAPHCGLCMAVASSFMFSLCSVLVKVLSNVPETELAVFRFIGLLLPSLPILIYKAEQPYPKGFRMMLLFRGIFGTASLLLQFYAFRHMPLADASVIIFSVPAFVSIFARIFLKESCGRFQALLISLTICGVIIISRPPWIFGTLSESYSKENWQGSIAAMGSTVIAANCYILLRALKNIHYAVIMTDFALVALIITPIVTAITGDSCIPPCGVTRWLILAIGFLSFAGQFLLTKALQIEQAGPVSIARTSDVVFAFVWQLVFFGEAPNFLTVIGAFLVTSSVILLGLRRWLFTLPEASGIRRRLAILTF